VRYFLGKLIKQSIYHWSINVYSSSGKLGSSGQGVPKIHDKSDFVWGLAQTLKAWFLLGSGKMFQTLSKYTLCFIGQGVYTNLYLYRVSQKCTIRVSLCDE
jgi:hypothetical protein